MNYKNLKSILYYFQYVIRLPVNWLWLKPISKEQKNVQKPVNRMLKNPKEKKILKIEFNYLPEQITNRFVIYVYLNTFLFIIIIRITSIISNIPLQITREFETNVFHREEFVLVSMITL